MYRMKIKGGGGDFKELDFQLQKVFIYMLVTYLPTPMLRRVSLTDTCALPPYEQNNHKKF